MRRLNCDATEWYCLTLKELLDIIKMNGFQPDENYQLLTILDAYEYRKGIHQYYSSYRIRFSFLTGISANSPGSKNARINLSGTRKENKRCSFYQIQAGADQAYE